MQLKSAELCLVRKSPLDCGRAISPLSYQEAKADDNGNEDNQRTHRIAKFTVFPPPMLL